MPVACCQDTRTGAGVESLTLDERCRCRRSGFTVFNTIIDQRALRNIALSTYSALTVVVPLLAGLAEFDEMEAEVLESELFGNVSGTPTGG